MKRILFYFAFILIALISDALKAQVMGSLYGMTAHGGVPRYEGTLFKISANAYSKVNLFNGANGGYPGGSLLQAPDGYFYGTGDGGGSYNNGVIFKYKPGGTIAPIYNFVAPTENPECTLIMASDGNLYGTTHYGGQGCIFRCTPSGVFDTIHWFNYTTGAFCDGGVIQGTDGNLYGITGQGGKYNRGTIFKCTLGGAFTVLVNLDSATGDEASVNGLLQVGNNTFYGFTSYGGAHNFGTVFKCTTSGVFSIIANFSNNDYIGSPGHLILGADSNLYGCLGDKIFKCSLSGNLSTVCILPKPYVCEGSLLQASDSSFYGTALNFNNSDPGLLFKCTPSGNYSTLVNFNDTNGGYPIYNGLIEYMTVSINSCTKGILTSSVIGGGLGTYHYKWSTGDTTPNIKIITPGVYYITVTNTRGISASDTIDFVGPFIDSTSAISPSCPNGNNGIIYAITSGGVPPYSYLWSTIPVQTSSPATLLVPGSYTVTIINANGCKIRDSATIINPPQPADSQYIALCQGQTLIVGKHIYDTTGLYKDTLTAKAGCDSIVITNILVTPIPVITVSGHDSITPGSSDTLVAKGNSSSYNWSTGSTNDTIIVSPTSINTYTVTGILNGCSNSAVFVVKIDSALGINNLSLFNNEKWGTLYPDPAKQTLQLSFSIRSAENATIKIIDMTGSVLETDNRTILNNDVIQFDISGLSSGVYFADIRIEGISQVLKFVKE